MLNLTLATCRHYKKVLRFNRLVTSTSKIHHPCVGPFYYLNAMIDPTPGKPPSSVMEFHTLQIYIRVMVFCCPMLLGTTVPMIHFKPMILWRKPFWASDFMGKGNEMGREGKGKEREGKGTAYPFWANDFMAKGKGNQREREGKGTAYPSWANDFMAKGMGNQREGKGKGREQHILFERMILWRKGREGKWKGREGKGTAYPFWANDFMAKTWHILNHTYSSGWESAELE